MDSKTISPKGKDAPCLGCADRHIGCHSDCERYKAFKGRTDGKNQDRIAYLKAHPHTKFYAKSFDNR